MQEEYSGYPRITGGSNIAVEALPDGYRINAVASSAAAYHGFFMVRPYPNYMVTSPIRAIQVVDGRLPYEESLTSSAGHVSIDRIHYFREEDKDGEGELKIGARRLRVSVPPTLSLSIPEGHSTVFLQISAHRGGDSNSYPESGGGRVSFSSRYHVLTKSPEVEEGTIYIPLAEIECDGTGGGFSVTQLNSGEPSGVIMNYYGSSTMDSGSGEDSGEGSGSGEPSSADSSSTGEGSGSGGEPSGSEPEPEPSDSGEPSSSAPEPEPEPSDSGDPSASEPGPEPEPSDSGEPSGSEPGPEPEPSDSGEPSYSGTEPSFSGDTPGGEYDPDKWYLVADCIRYRCHPDSGLENYSGTIGYYMAKGGAIGFPPEPAPPTAARPIAEWTGVVMIEGPFDSRLDVDQGLIDEYNELHLGDSC